MICLDQRSSGPAVFYSFTCVRVKYYKSAGPLVHSALGGGFL